MDLLEAFYENYLSELCGVNFYKENYFLYLILNLFYILKNE